MDYPVGGPQGWDALEPLSVRERIAILFRERHIRRRARRYAPSTLIPVRFRAPPAPDEIVLICVERNAAKHLPSLLRHYRRLGIRRFAFVDDRSTDGSREWLLDQDDVDLFESPDGYQESQGGLIWRDMLLDIYGRDRWFVSIDSDEYLVFPGCETRQLPDFIEDLDRHRLKRCHAVMLDIYPDGPLGSAVSAPDPEDFPTTVSPLFDGTGYELQHERFGTAARGGPRRRLFGVDMRLSKYPLLFADARLQFTGSSAHGPLPIRWNFTAVHAVLLHHKFAAGSVQDFRDIATRGTHSRGSTLYRRIVDRDDFSDASDLRYGGTATYEGSEKLVADGFMQDLRR